MRNLKNFVEEDIGKLTFYEVVSPDSNNLTGVQTNEVYFVLPTAIAVLLLISSICLYYGWKKRYTASNKKILVFTLGFLTLMIISLIILDENSFN